MSEQEKIENAFRLWWKATQEPEAAIRVEDLRRAFLAGVTWGKASLTKEGVRCMACDGIMVQVNLTWWHCPTCHVYREPPLEEKRNA